MLITIAATYLLRPSRVARMSDVPWVRERFKTKPDDFFIAPTAIADEAWHVANQPRSAWAFNVEVRPYGDLVVQTCRRARQYFPWPVDLARRVPLRSEATDLPFNPCDQVDSS
jgi:hypothetical protein